MSKTNWKGFERDVGKALEVERYSKTALGEESPDIIKYIGKYFLVIECKNRKYINVDEEMNEVEKYRRDKKDIIILCLRKTNSKKTGAYMKMKDFKKLYKWLKKLMKTKKTYLQTEEIVVRLDWNDFLWMVKTGEKVGKRSGKI